VSISSPRCWRQQIDWSYFGSSRTFTRPIQSHGTTQF